VYLRQVEQELVLQFFRRYWRASAAGLLLVVVVDVVALERNFLAAPAPVLVILRIVVFVFVFVVVAREYNAIDETTQDGAREIQILPRNLQVGCGIGNGRGRRGTTFPAAVPLILVVI